MSKMEFNSSPEPTIGVEIELALVDADTMALTPGCQPILERLPEDILTGVKPELMQSYIEINSAKCNTISEIERDMRQKLLAVQNAGDDLGVNLYWSATHPFSPWSEQQVTETERYHNLIHLLQDTARQLVTFGLHVHVGVDSGDKAIMVCDRMLRHLPTLLAASCNSPYWEGRVTGLASWRSRVMDGLPTAGLPPLMRNWSEYVWLVNHMVDTGFIQTIREIWWDLRPHHNFGTVEVRICDVPGTLEDAMALASVIHCLVKRLSDDIEEGTYQHDCHPMMVRQNKWRAARYGLEAELVDSNDYSLQSARLALGDMLDYLTPTAQHLDCAPQFDRMREFINEPNWSARQIAILDETNDPAEVVRQMTQLSRIQS